ncbi:hypothetical protein OF846_003623 [Rhodotorula toruloides]|nr:hypothetical protein OF846_003623 [Rhodotorula toruloides]
MSGHLLHPHLDEDPRGSLVILPSESTSLEQQGSAFTAIASKARDYGLKILSNMNDNANLLPSSPPLVDRLYESLEPRVQAGWNRLYQRYMFASHGALLGTGETCQSMQQAILLGSFVAETFKQSKPMLLVVAETAAGVWRECFDKLAPSLSLVKLESSTTDFSDIQGLLGVSQPQTPRSLADVIDEFGLKSAREEESLWPQTIAGEGETFPVVVVDPETFKSGIEVFWQATYSLLLIVEPELWPAGTPDQLAFVRSDFRLVLSDSPMPDATVESYDRLALILPEIFHHRQPFFDIYDPSNCSGPVGHLASVEMKNVLHAALELWVLDEDEEGEEEEEEEEMAVEDDEEMSG